MARMSAFLTNQIPLNGRKQNRKICYMSKMSNLNLLHGLALQAALQMEQPLSAWKVIGSDLVRDLRFFLCPMLVTCSLSHPSHSLTELIIHHLSLFHTENLSNLQVQSLKTFFLLKPWHYREILIINIIILLGLHKVLTKAHICSNRLVKELCSKQKAITLHFNVLQEKSHNLYLRSSL